MHSTVTYKFFETAHARTSRSVCTNEYRYNRNRFRIGYPSSKNFNLSNFPSPSIVEFSYIFPRFECLFEKKKKRNVNKNGKERVIIN